MIFGTPQSLRTITVLLPIGEVAEKQRETFEWLDEYTVSSFTLLGYMAVDAFLTEPHLRPNSEEMARSFWNLYDSAQKGVLVPGEIPDRIMESIEALCGHILTEIQQAESALRRPWPMPPGATGCILPFYGYDLLIQMSYPSASA